MYCFSTQKCFPLSLPLGSPQYNSEPGKRPVKSCRAYLCPSRGESRYSAYAMCHAVFLELVKDPAALLIWSGLRPSTAHQFCLIYIPEPTLYFYVRNQWEKILIELLALQEKRKRVQKICNGYNAFCKYIFCMLVYERIFLVVSL